MQRISRIPRKHRRTLTVLGAAIAAGLLNGCPTAPITESPSDPVCACDGSFSMIINYTNTTANPLPIQGAFGPAGDFSAISASPMNTTIPANSGIPVTLTGQLRDPCKAGLTSYTVNGNLVTNVTVHNSPFKTMQQSPANPVVASSSTPGTFTYDVTFTPCPAGPGAAPGPVKLTVGTLTHVTVQSVTPGTVAVPGGPTKVTVTGKFDKGFDDGSVLLIATDANGVICNVPLAIIHLN